MKALFLFMITLFIGCNSQEPKLSSLQGASSKSLTPQILYVAKLSTDGDYTLGTIDFEVKFTQVVYVLGTPSITVLTDSGPWPATYRSGSGTDTWIFKLNVIAGINDNDGISIHSPILLNGGSIYDIVRDEDAILSFALPDTSGITINKTTITPDGTSPSVTAIALEIPAKHTYKRSEANPVLIVTFDENVTVNLGSNDPYIDLNIGGTSIKAEFNGYVPGFLNKLKFLIVTNISTPLDLDGISFGDDLELADSLIKDVSGMAINTDITLISKPRFFIVPETLRDWFDANDDITTSTANVAYSKSSTLNLEHFGTINITSSSPKAFSFPSGSSLIADTSLPMYKVLIVYRNTTDPNGQTLMTYSPAPNTNGCYFDYLGNEVCTAFPGGVRTSKFGTIMNAMAIPVPITDDYGITFQGGYFRLGPTCTPAQNGCAWYDSSIAIGERLDDTMDSDGVLGQTYVSNDFGYHYSIVTFSGTNFQPLFGDNGFNGEIAEIMFFEDGFSTAAGPNDLTAIETYLGLKYSGITQW